MQRIESKDELIEAISKGEKSPLDFKIGTENMGVPIKIIFLALD